MMCTFIINLCLYVVYGSVMLDELLQVHKSIPEAARVISIGMNHP